MTREKRILIKVLSYLISFFLLLWFCFWLFNIEPVLGFIGGILFVLALIVFPYSKRFSFRSNDKQQS